MKDELKEILDMFIKYKDEWYSCEYILKPKQCVMLLDYITNLQQENKKLKEAYERLTEDYVKKEYIVKAIENVFNEVKGDDEK